jgi:hypothetical protein
MPAGQAARAFWASQQNYDQFLAKPGETFGLEPALDVIQHGAAFLETAKVWYEANS